ncbi:MAG: OsmC family protein [Spirosomataceae bacterium]
MKVTLKRVDDAFHFEAMGVSGVPNHIDANPEIGGANAGARPMEMLLMGLGGCSAIDVILILKKQRQILEDIQIEVSGERQKIEGTEMSPFTSMHIHFILTGDLDTQKVEKAIQMSMEKYCSATAQFQSSAQITHSFDIRSSH